MMTPFITLECLDTTGYATEPQAIPEWPHWKAGDCKAQMGHGIQGIPGVYGQLHERTGKTTITNSYQYNLWNFWIAFFLYTDCQYRGIHRWATSWKSRRSFN